MLPLPFRSNRSRQHEKFASIYALDSSPRLRVNWLLHRTIGPLSPRPPLLLPAVTFATLLLCLLWGCGGGMNSMTTQPMSTTAFVFVANSGSASVSAFAMSSAGSLTPVAGSPFPAGAGAEFMAFDGVHKLLFVNNQSANTVSA